MAVNENSLSFSNETRAMRCWFKATKAAQAFSFSNPSGRRKALSLRSCLQPVKLLGMISLACFSVNLARALRKPILAAAQASAAKIVRLNQKAKS
jgi:hypothetical protein